MKAQSQGEAKAHRPRSSIRLPTSNLQGPVDDEGDEDEEDEEYIPPDAAYPSISPRPVLDYDDDKDHVKATHQYFRQNSNLGLLLQEMEVAVLRYRPENIASFFADDFFSGKNAAVLYQLLEKKKKLEEST
jgi:hypothetical protein